MLWSTQDVSRTRREGSPLVEPVCVGRDDGRQAVRRLRGGLDAQRLLRGQEYAGGTPQRQHGAPEHGPAQQTGQPSELFGTWENVQAIDSEQRAPQDFDVYT